MKTVITLFAALLISSFTYAQQTKSHEATHVVQQKTPREKGSGQATGKRQHKPFSTQAPRDAASGRATGKRQHKPFTVKKPKDNTSGKSTGRRQHGSVLQNNDPVVRKKPGRAKYGDITLKKGAHANSNSPHQNTSRRKKKRSGTNYNSSRSNN